MIGGAGRDVLVGGGGADAFLFGAIREFSGATICAADVITDFASAQGERIDLSGVDAIRSTAAVNEAFKWIGTAAFSKQSGELRYTASGGVGLVSGDIDGNGIADLPSASTGPLPSPLWISFFEPIVELICSLWSRSKGETCAPQKQERSPRCAGNTDHIAAADWPGAGDGNG